MLETFASMVMIHLLYVYDIVLMERGPYDLNKQLKILKDFFSSMGMFINTDKTKVVIIKSQKITYDNFMYDKTTWRKLLHTNILELIFIKSLTTTITLRKLLMEGGKLIMDLKTIVNQLTFFFKIRRNSSLRLSLLLLSYMDVKFKAKTSFENHGE